MTWIDIKKRLPPKNEFVEVIYADGNRLTEHNRDFAAYTCDDNGCFWVSHSMDEREWSKDGFGIIYWRKMKADHLGRKAYLEIKKYTYEVVLSHKKPKYNKCQDDTWF